MLDGRRFVKEKADRLNILVGNAIFWICRLDTPDGALNLPVPPF
jgi:hypothetical protein